MSRPGSYATASRSALITSVDYDKTRGNAAIRDGHADFVAYGKPFIANPDLPQRFRIDAPLNQWNAATFYGHGTAGYTDYPALGALNGSATHPGQA